MTAVVGILCNDGVVIGSDSSSTFTQLTRPTIEQKTKKVHIIDNRVIVAGTGQMGLGQRFCGIVEDLHSKKIFAQKPYLEVGRLLAELSINNFASTKVDKGQYGALLAYASGNHFYLCEFALTDFQPEWKNDKMWFVSLGSGQTITDPFLGLMRRVFWKDNLPSVADAIFVATWTLQHAIDLNTGGINGPVQLAALRKNPTNGHFEASMLSDDELQEHMNNVDEVEKYLAKYKEILGGAENIRIPTPTQPPTS